MPINKPTPAQLEEWEQKLSAENLTNPDKPWYGATALTSDVVDEAPAKPVRNGGVFWSRRSGIHWIRQDRKRRPRVRHCCPACGAEFEATKRARYCSVNCRVRAHDRRKAVLRKITHT